MWSSSVNLQVWSTGFKWSKAQVFKVFFFSSQIQAQISQVYSFQGFISNMLCLCHYGPALLGFLFQTNLGSKNSASVFKSTGGEDLISPWSRVGFILWLVKIWQESSFEKVMQHLESCLLWQLKLKSFVSTCDVFNCLFPLDVQNEIQLLSTVFCYSWLVCLLSFWLRNATLVKIR